MATPRSPRRSMNMPNSQQTYQINSSRVVVRIGDIVESAADIIVSSDDDKLSMGGGVSAAILRAGGDDISRDASKHFDLSVGDVATTSAGRLKAKHIFHAVTRQDGTPPSS